MIALLGDLAKFLESECEALGKAGDIRHHILIGENPVVHTVGVAHDGHGHSLALEEGHGGVDRSQAGSQQIEGESRPAHIADDHIIRL